MYPKPTHGWRSVDEFPQKAGVAILHAIYAIYHLARSSRGRTPASSASYMLFAAIIDVSLVPFYVFAALMARAECTEPVGTPNSWQTLFNDSAITYKIVYSTFLICVTCGSLHLISLLLSLYLGVLFRKISRLPPDMNPLEDNLTSRHKRNKSSILENSNNQASMATSNSGLESEIDDPLISPRRSVPFMHTRNDSGSNLSEVPHPNASPRASRSDISTSLYGQPSSERNSRTIMSSILGHPPIQGPSNLTSRTHFPILTLPNRQPTIPDLTEKAQSRAQSTPGKQPPQDQQQTLNRSPTTSSSVYSTDTTTATNTTMNARSLSTVPSLPDNNWITHPSSSPSPSPSPPRELKNLGKKGAYQPLSQISPFEYTFNNENQPPYIRKHPLEMNPPTPVTKQWKRRATQNQQRALTPGNGNVKHHGNWNQGPGIVGIGKARAWRGMAQQVGRPNGDGRVVSRSGVEVRGGGILPNGGVRAREVSGKLMEEGRGTSNWDLIA